MTVTSVADTLGNSWTDAGVVTQSSSTQTFKTDVWYANQAAASGADTITVTLSTTTTKTFITCLEFSGTSTTLRAAEQTNTGTYTSGTSFTASVTSFTPTSGDLNYAYVGYLSCQATGTITYATGFTAGTGKGNDFGTGTNCITGPPAKKFQFNEADQYFPNTGTTATTASFGIADSAPTTNTGGWAEIVLQFQPSSTAITTTYSVTQSNSLVQAVKKTPTKPLLSAISLAQLFLEFENRVGSLSLPVSVATIFDEFETRVRTLVSTISATFSLLKGVALTESLTAAISLATSFVKSSIVNRILAATVSLIQTLTEAETRIRNMTSAISLVTSFATSFIITRILVINLSVSPVISSSSLRIVSVFLTLVTTVSTSLITLKGLFDSLLSAISGLFGIGTSITPGPTMTTTTTTSSTDTGGGGGGGGGNACTADDIDCQQGRPSLQPINFTNMIIAAIILLIIVIAYLMERKDWEFGIDVEGEDTDE